MTTITFYKDNKIDGKHEVPVKRIIKEYFETEESKQDMPFERKLINFMSINYGSFDILSEKEWSVIHEEKRNQKPQHYDNSNTSN